MWSQPKISVIVHAIVATALLVAYVASAAPAAREHHPDWYAAGWTVLLPVATLNYLAAGIHLLRWLR